MRQKERRENKREKREKSKIEKSIKKSTTKKRIMKTGENKEYTQFIFLFPRVASLLNLPVVQASPRFF